MEPCGDGGTERIPDAVVSRGGAMRHEPHPGHLRARVGARRKVEAAIASLARGEPGLERRRGAAQHDGHAAAVSAPDGGVARVVANVVLLLERRVVLFVDDDEPERRKRREDREARAEHELRLPARGRAPRIAPLACRERAVHERDAKARARRTHAIDELRREVDLRHEHQHLADRLASTASAAAR